LVSTSSCVSISIFSMSVNSLRTWECISPSPVFLCRYLSSLKIRKVYSYILSMSSIESIYFDLNYLKLNNNWPDKPQTPNIYYSQMIPDFSYHQYNCHNCGSTYFRFSTSPGLRRLYSVTLAATKSATPL
jgi:hypothetical protein